MKTIEDIEKCREISARLKELGIPDHTLKNLDLWIDKEEKLTLSVKEECQTCVHWLPTCKGNPALTENDTCQAWEPPAIVRPYE